MKIEGLIRAYLGNDGPVATAVIGEECEPLESASAEESQLPPPAWSLLSGANAVSPGLVSWI